MLSASLVSAVHAHQSTVAVEKGGRPASFSFQGRKCVFEGSFVFCLGTFESKFLQKLDSASVWPSFSPFTSLSLPL